MSDLTQTRMAYGEALLELGGQRQDIVVLDADLYTSTRSELFAKKFPERFFDIGIAEQDLVSTSAGLAACNYVPYANSFAIFLTGRCYDQIRTQVAYPKLPVRLVGSSAGLTQGPDGATHQSLEDIALMRALPNMTVIVPADAEETWQATKAMADVPGPVYFRLGRYPVPSLFGSDYRFQVGRMALMRDGKDIVVFSTGHMTWKALEAAELLAKDGVGARVVNVSTIKPLAEAEVFAYTEGVRKAFTVEEHNIIGGLGSAVAEVLSARAGTPLVRLGVLDVFGESATADELLEKHGLQPKGLSQAIIAALK